MLRHVKIDQAIFNFQELHTTAQGLRIKVIATQSTPICSRGGFMSSFAQANEPK